MAAALAAAHVPLVASLHIAFLSDITFRTAPVGGLVLLLMVFAAGTLSRASFALKATIWVAGTLLGYVLLQEFAGSLAVQTSYFIAGAISLTTFLLIAVLMSWLDD